MADIVTLGRRIRHFRTRAGLTLDQLSARTGVAASQWSLMENGKREPRLSLLTDLAGVLDVPLAALLEEAAPSERMGLEIALEKAQASPVFQELGLDPLRISRTMPDDVLRTLVGLHGELERRAHASLATPEQARLANTRQRHALRVANGYLPEIEELANAEVEASGHHGGALTHRTVAQMAERHGFTIIHTDDLPHSARCVVDLENGRIFIPPASIPGGHGLRSLALQAVAHTVLGHQDPQDYEEFLQQRLEVSYFAAVCLMPRKASVDFLQEAKADRNIAIEDFRDAYGVTHDAAAMRFTNLAAVHLGIPLHYVRVAGDGAMVRAYENDGLPLPLDASGSIDGQMVCRHWSARRAFARTTRTTEYYQYTDTPAGTFFESTQTGTANNEDFSITLGVPYRESRWFRGRESTERFASTCPDPSCCRRPSPELAARWSGKTWASARVHAHTFSPLPQGTYPGVDDRELYEFLGSHADDES